MKRKLIDMIFFCAVFILLSDVSRSEYAYKMGKMRVLIPAVAAILASITFYIFHKTPIDRSWKGIVDVFIDILLFGCTFIAMCMLHLWGFVGTEFFPVCTAEGFNFITTSWMIFFVISLLIRITLITEKLFHWWERRNIKIKLIE